MFRPNWPFSISFGLEKYLFAFTLLLRDVNGRGRTVSEFHPFKWRRPILIRIGERHGTFLPCLTYHGNNLRESEAARFPEQYRCYKKLPHRTNLIY
ncbi:hypothetical protein pipiens_019989 [Culex pipiens pipiens]|uniref:Uncharacterized protein n=1 Tax=Culex pipiens pipiens TaxID=38569 RepID=A0ABD1DQ65_CULPP